MRYWRMCRLIDDGFPAQGRAQCDARTLQGLAQKPDRPLALARSWVRRISRPFTTVVLMHLVRAGAGPWPDRPRRALGEPRCCGSHRSLLAADAQHAVHMPREQGPGRGAVPVGGW